MNMTPLDNLIEKLDITASDLASFVGVERSNFLKMVNGKRDFDMELLFLLAELDALVFQVQDEDLSARKKSSIEDDQQKAQEYRNALDEHRRLLVGKQTKLKADIENLTHIGEKAERRILMLQYIKDQIDPAKKHQHLWIEDLIYGNSRRVAAYRPEQLVLKQAQLAGVEAEIKFMENF
jgi:transcriptional regulator with XRE-family HTH domain